MKKTVYMFVFFCLAFVSAYAADVQDIRQQRDAEISRITSQVRDIEARYWANSVEQNRVSLGELEQTAQTNWLGTLQERMQLMELIKQYLAKGSVPPLTADELAQLDENKQQVQAFLNDGRQNPAAAALAARNRRITQIKQPVFDLEARYWAWRVVQVKDVTMEELSAQAENWVGERSTNRRLMQAVEKNIKEGNTAALSKKEVKRLEEANRQVRNLLK